MIKKGVGTMEMVDIEMMDEELTDREIEMMMEMQYYDMIERKVQVA